MSEISSTKLHVLGVRDSDDVREALQSLYDIFAAEGLGQATFELDPDGAGAWLFIKHRAEVVPDRAEIARALAEAGDYRLQD